ncbi:MAG: PA domain-containing protein, partial [Steroidobacteraceae bacterium]
VAHGLGFSNFADESDPAGVFIDGQPDVYMVNTRDISTGQQWNTMTPEEVVASAVRTGSVVWSGERVTEEAPLRLAPFQGLQLTGAVSTELTYQTATFGPLPDTTNFNGQVVLATSAAGGTESNGCTASGAMNSFGGKVALIQRGSCTFAEKTKNAQLVGASAVLIYNNQSGLPGMGGTDASIVIPAVGISQADGVSIKNASGAVNVAYFTDPTRPPIGTATDPESGTNFVRLYAPSTYASGSSISHFDVVAVPNLLLEPSISPNLKGATDLDLTPAQLHDVGWGLVNGSSSVAIWGCDTTVPKDSTGGTALETAVTSCAANTRNAGQFQACVVKASASLVSAGLITGRQSGIVSACAAGN